MNRWILILILAASVNLSVPAKSSAGEPPDDATQAFKEGIELFDQGEYEKASAAFRKANKLNSNWKILYNIGQSEASSKRYGLALEAFEAYLAQAGDDIELARRDEVLAEVQRLKLMVGSVDIEAPEGSKIFIDGEWRATTPLAGPILVPSGITHTVEIKTDDTVIHTQSIKLSSGQSRTVVVDETASVTENPKGESEETTASDKSPNVTSAETDAKMPKNEATVHSDSRSNAAAFSLMALGGAALLGGAVTGTIALKRGKDLESDYPDGVPESQEDKMKSIDKLALTTDILLGVGIVAAGLGAILLIRNKRQGKESPVTAAPALGPQFAGFAVEGRF